tara:strand:+ start:267 stop:530 length:264 start_codon:yes stop_codon:yes gene_type:complete
MGINPALIDLICGCKYLAVSIIVVAAMIRSLFVLTVIVVSVIVRRAVVIKPEKPHSNVQVKNTRKAVPVDLIMPLGKIAFVSAKSIK